MLKYILFVSLLIVGLHAQQQQFIRDTLHHIEWQDNVARDELKWKLATGYCKQLSLDGFNDWRLPTQKELIDLAKSKKMKKSFQFLENEIYWSSESDKNENLNAMTIYMGNGFVSSSDKCDKNFYICVRDSKK